MTAYFYLNLNAQPSGDHEVHRGTCYWLSLTESREYLGYFSNSFEALRMAQSKHPLWRVDGCAFCCPESNTD